MQYGISVFDASGLLTLNTEDMTYSGMDTFEVSPLSSGSRVYTNSAIYNIALVQSQVEPLSIDINRLRSFNSVVLSSYNSGSNKIVSWSPNKQKGNIYNVIIYVLGS